MRAKYTIADIAWVVAYVATISAVVGLLLNWRARTLDHFDTPQTQAQWDVFRADMKKIADDPASSVDRQPPRSAEKPDLRLARDYFGVCLMMAVLLSSLLFATLMFMVRGVIGGENFTPRKDAG